MSLTHTPAYTTNHPERFENEETGCGYSVMHDNDAEDPRTWIDNEHVALWACREPRLAHSVGGDKPEGNIAIDAFARYYDLHDAETSLEMTRRYLATFRPEKKITVAISTIRGYAQGHWLDAVCAVADGYGIPESHIDRRNPQR